MYQYTQDAVGAGYSPFYAPYPYGLAVPAAVDIVGADAADTRTTWQKVKDWGDQKTLGVQRKWLVAGAVAIGVIWYGYSAGWFGRDPDGYMMDF